MCAAAAQSSCFDCAACDSIARPDHACHREQVQFREILTRCSALVAQAHPARTSHREKWWSALGGFLGILATFGSGLWWFGPQPGLAMVASLGASSVLLFAAPHSPLSQPWNVIGGHFVSAVVGVTVAKLLGEASVLVAAALAAGLAIAAMFYFRCLHPPGGATALVAVLGGAQIHELGFRYVLAPVAVNAVVILALALLFGSLSRVRRYPAGAAAAAPVLAKPSRAAIDHDDLVFALEKLDTVIDVDTDDLLTIYQLATGHHADAETASRLARKPPRAS